MTTTTTRAEDEGEDGARDVDASDALVEGVREMRVRDDDEDGGAENVGAENVGGENDAAAKKKKKKKKKKKAKVSRDNEISCTLCFLIGQSVNLTF